MTEGTANLVLAILRLGIMAANQITLASMETLHPETRADLLNARDDLTAEIDRLDSLGEEL